MTHTHILNGVIKFGRTVKTGDFENKRCDVELSFGTEEGKEVEEHALDTIGKLARRKVHELLELQKPDATPAFLGSEPAKSDKEKLAAQVTAGEPPKKAGRPKKPPAVDPETAGMMEDEKPAPKVEAKDASDMDEDLTMGVAADITDEELVQAATRRNAVIRNALAIRQLVGKYITPPKQMRDIPQEQRQAFLDELAKVGTPA